MKHQLLLIPILFTLLFLSLPTHVHAPIIPHEYTLDIPTYAPTKITFNYAYTHNHSLYDVSTFGQSLYTHSGGPSFMEFIAEDIDDYFFTLELCYNHPINQTLLIGVWSGSLPVIGDTEISIWYTKSLLGLEQNPYFSFDDRCINIMFISLL